MARIRRPRARRVIDQGKISELGKDFFSFVSEREPDWQTSWEKPQLRACFMEDYKKWLLDEHNKKPGYNFSTMLFHLKRQRKLNYQKDGHIRYHGTAGYATVDQHAHLPKEVPGEPRNRIFPTVCEECRVKLTSEQSQRDHVKGARHRLNLTTLALRKQAAELMEDKHGVSIESGAGIIIEEGRIIVPCTQGEVATTSLIISCREEAVDLEIAMLLTKDRRLYITDREGVSEGKKILPMKPGESYSVSIRCDTDDLGDARAPIAFAFKLPTSKQVFHIFRNVLFSVGGDDREDLKPTAPYTHPSKIALKPLSKNVLSGSPPPFSGSGKLPQKVQMENYFIPDEVAKKLNSGNLVGISNLTESLTSGNYSEKFTNLLYSEEHQMKVDIRRYNKREAVMRKSRDQPGLLNLEVPGLAENRPSVLRGDHLYASFSDGSQDKSYRGFVHHIQQEVVSLHFHSSLVEKFIANMKFDIKFTFSRFPLRLQHHAVDAGSLKMGEMEEVLFPEPKELQNTEIPKLRLFNRILETNPEQVQAVHHILSGSSLPAPYLVFGPPGTGKTVTIVEAMKQVYQEQKDSYILACTPSNSAADLIARRLLETGPVAKTTLLRMSALSRSWEGVDPELQKCRQECLNYTIDYSVFFPDAEEVMKRRIVVVTMVTAGRLVLSGSFQDHFTHIFLDESGHAIEPEALIPVAGLLPRNGQLVLAGDPKQLGPVLRSPISNSNGLELSLLERLMTTEEAYQRQEGGLYNDRMLTKLLCNYRSHPDILEQPNQMFYDGELKVCADQLLRESLCRIDQLPKKGFPVIFHGIEGKDEREESSPSFFNVSEAEQVMKYVKDLLDLQGHKKIRKTDIGIISPYRKQVQKIKKLLVKRNLEDIKVGSVEEFQGQERLIIIISTVRSTREDFLKMDKDYKLGFLKNPKRFNVAITRAKALLICIGNPYMLSKDEHWNKFLEYCHENGAYTGCPYTPEEDEMEIEELTSKMVGLNIVPDVSQEDVSAIIDPEWRGQGNI